MLSNVSRIVAAALKQGTITETKGPQSTNADLVTCSSTVQETPDAAHPNEPKQILCQLRGPRGYPRKVMLGVEVAICRGVGWID